MGVGRKLEYGLYPNPDTLESEWVFESKVLV